MKTLTKIFFLMLMLSIVIFGIWLAFFSVNAHLRTEQRITKALESGYPFASLSINDRQDGYYHEICFDVKVHLKSQPSAKKQFVMVVGDNDGGTWRLGHHKYSSMQECENAFERG